MEIEDDVVARVMGRLVKAVGPSFVSRHTKNLELIVKLTIEELDRKVY